MSPGQRELAIREVMHVEHHLDKRRTTWVPHRAQFLHQFLEGHVLVGVRAQGNLADPSQQLPERGVAGEVGAEDQGIEKAAEESFELDPVAARHRRADDDIVGPV